MSGAEVIIAELRLEHSLPMKKGLSGFFAASSKYLRP